MPRRKRGPARPPPKAGPKHEARSFEPQHPEPLREGEKHDHLAERATRAKDRQDALLDEALEETFPSSDPISPKRIT